MTAVAAWYWWCFAGIAGGMILLVLRALCSEVQHGQALHDLTVKAMNVRLEYERRLHERTGRPMSMLHPTAPGEEPIIEVGPADEAPPPRVAA